MSTHNPLSGVTHQFNTWIGKLAMWFVLATTLVNIGAAIARAAFDASLELSETDWRLLAAAMVLACGHALLRLVHSIDEPASRPRTRRWRDHAQTADEALYTN